MIALKDEQVLNSFHLAGFFYELKVETNKHNKLDKKSIDGAEKKGWHTTIDIKTEVHGYNGKTANIISSGKRIKKDRTLIEEYSAFYAFKIIGKEWKMYAISQLINND